MNQKTQAQKFHVMGYKDDNLDTINTTILVSDINEFTKLKQHAVSITKIVENKYATIISLKLDDSSEKEILIFKNNLVAIEDNDFIGYIRDSILLSSEDLSVIHPEFGERRGQLYLKR